MKKLIAMTVMLAVLLTLFAVPALAAEAGAGEAAPARGWLEDVMDFLGANLEKIFAAVAALFTFAVLVLQKKGLIPVVVRALTSAKGAADTASKMTEQTAAKLLEMQETLEQAAETEAEKQQQFLAVQEKCGEMMATLFACINTTPENRERFTKAYAAFLQKCEKMKEGAAGDEKDS